MADEKQRKAFLSTLMPFALAASKATGVDARIILAQAALETGWGVSAPHNNYFGIKDFSGGGALLDTTEERNGVLGKEKARFRIYDDMADSFADYASFINGNSRYNTLRNGKSIDEQIAALGKSGYATASNYGDVVGNIARGIEIDPNAQPPELKGVVQPMPESRTIAPAPNVASVPMHDSNIDPMYGSVVSPGGNALGTNPTLPNAGLPGNGGAYFPAAPRKGTDFYAMAGRYGSGLLGASAAPEQAMPQMPDGRAYRGNMQLVGLLNPFNDDSAINPFKRRGLL